MKSSPLSSRFSSLSAGGAELMVSFVAKISSQVLRGNGRTMIPSAVFSRDTTPARPSAWAQSAGSWMRLPGSRVVVWVVVMGQWVHKDASEATRVILVRQEKGSERGFRLLRAV